VSSDFVRCTSVRVYDKLRIVFAGILPPTLIVLRQPPGVGRMSRGHLQGLSNHGENHLSTVTRRRKDVSRTWCS
jgi:hypothetical protein